MEYMDLGSLDNVIQNVGIIHEPQISWIALSVLKAMRYLKESLQLMHRGNFFNRKLISSIFRYQAYEHLDQQFWKCQIVRFRYFENTRWEHGFDLYRIEILHGSKLLFDGNYLLYFSRNVFAVNRIRRSLIFGVMALRCSKLQLVDIRFHFCHVPNILNVFKFQWRRLTKTLIRLTMKTKVRQTRSEWLRLNFCRTLQTA